MVKNVLVPIHAPWSKTAEVIDFVTAMRAEHAYPIHDAGLSDRGLPLVEKHVTLFGGHYGTGYRHLSPRGQRGTGLTGRGAVSGSGRLARYLLL